MIMLPEGKKCLEIMRSKNKDISYSYREVEQFLVREAQRFWKDLTRSVSYSERDKKQYELSAKKQRFAMIDNAKMSYGRLYSGIITTTKGQLTNDSPKFWN
jgi:hypothetical protein